MKSRRHSPLNQYRKSKNSHSSTLSLSALFTTFVFVYGGMVGGFLLEQVVSWNQWVGLIPRQLDLTVIQRVLLSWTAHGNWEHLKGNSLSMLPFVFMLCLLEKKPVSVLMSLIIISSSLFWLLSDHAAIGASGLFFALFGYMAAGAIIVRNWKYIVIVGAFGLLIGFGHYQHYFLSLFQPQEGISTFGHWMGFVAGILLAYLKLKNQERLHQKFI